MGRKTPKDFFIGTRPYVSHIHIFGSVCYCHVHADNTKKLDPFGEKGLLVGYSEISNAYRVYIPARRRIIVNRDVQFDEDREGVKLEEAKSNSQHRSQESSWRRQMCRYRYRHRAQVLVVRGSQMHMIH